MTQRAEFTFEIEETIVLKQGGYFITEFCPRCQQMVDMLSPDLLLLVTGLSERHIFQLIESDMIHFVESGRIVGCLSCLRKSQVVTR